MVDASVRWWAVYSRCPRCSLVAANSMRAPFFGELLEEPDWTTAETLLLCCGSCDHRHPISTSDRHTADRTTTCPACGTATAHPAAAALARCLSCGLLFRVDAVPDSVRARNGPARVAFDGWTVTLTRLWWPAPGGRHRHIPLDRIVGAEYAVPLSDAGSATDIRFVVHLRGEQGHRALWLWAFRDVWQPRRALRFEALSVAINEAVRGRIRLLVAESVGLGPWSQSQWSDIERQVPEVRDVYRSRSRTHREEIDWQLRAMRGEADPVLAGWPRPVHGVPSIDREPYMFGPRSDGIWHTLAERLCDHRDVRTSPRWPAIRSSVLGYAHHWLTVTPDRLLRKS